MSSSALLSITFLVIFTAAFATAGIFYPPKAALMPLLVGGSGAALSLLQLIRDLRNRPETDPIDLARDLPIYLWVWAFITAIIAFGFVYAAPPMLLLYLRLRAHETWRLSLLISLGVFAVLTGLFQTMLGVDLFEGLIPPLVADWLAPP